MTKAGFAGLGLFALFVAISSAVDKPARSTAPRVVKVMDCKITLIDHVTQASDRSGILKSVNYTEGDAVVAGCQIALIDDRVAIANLAVAEMKASNTVEIKYAEAAAMAALKELDMMEKSNKKYHPSPTRSKGDTGRTNIDLASEDLSAVAKSEIEKARLAARKAELSIDQSKHELELNKLNRDVTKAELDTYSVNAEFDGVVVKVYKKKGEAVRQGDPVAEIVNTDRVRIKGRVSLADLPFAKQGAKVRVRLSVDDLELPEEDEVFEGRITFVDLVSNEMDQSTQVHAEVKNRDNILRAGLDASMEILVDEAVAADHGNPAKERIVEQQDSNSVSDQ
jgi:membrane fusion protein, multidrug efflux system